MVAFQSNWRMPALAPWLPQLISTAMAHVPAFLIVLTLTGQPVANALCINWCDISSERQHCGDAIAHSTPPALAAAGSTCAAFLTASPFLKEEGRRGITAITLGTGPAVDSGLTGREFVHPRASGDAARGRRVPALVLRV